MKLIEDVKMKLTPEGRKRVFKDVVRLSTEHMIETANPKAFTKEYLIEVVFKKFKIAFQKGNYYVDTTGRKIKVDYHLTNSRGDTFLAQAKPMNFYLYVSGPDGAVNKIRRMFRIAEVRDKFKFGIATNGIDWVFIDKKGKVYSDVSILRNPRKIKDFLKGKKVVDSDHFDEDTLKAWEEVFD